MGKHKVDRQAVARANGYVRGAKREQDQQYCETFYTNESKQMQDRVLSDYIKWASEEDEEIRNNGLRQGHPVPDLATIKDFIRFYISSTNGMLALRPTKSSVLNFAERFFAGFTRLTKSVFPKKDTQDVYRWIKKNLVQDGEIEDIRRAKHMFTPYDLTEIIVSIWTDDDPVFIHPRYRLQLTFAILIYCYSGARIGAFIPDTSKKDTRGLRYEDIELYIYRRPDGEIELFFRLSEIWVKNNDNPKNTVFRLAMREHGKLRFNPVPWLLEMAIEDGAFLHFHSLDTLKRWNPDNNEPTALLWNPSVAKQPVLRQVTRSGGLSNSAWIRTCFCNLFRAVVINAGYPEIITIHTLRRGLANRLDKVATDSERGQILTQKDPNVFGRSYIDSTSALSSMDVFLGEKMRLDHIEYLRGVGKYRAIGYPRTLPAERQHAISTNQDLVKLETRLKGLESQVSTNNDHIDLESESSSDENDNDDIHFAIKLTKKQIQVLKTRLYNSSLDKYRKEWVQSRTETKVKTGGRSPDTLVYNDVANCMFKAQPDRRRIANLIPMDEHLSFQGMLSVVESLLSYCTKDYNVFYRPGQEPVNGRCPVGRCDLESLTRPKRSNHIQNCQRDQRCKELGYTKAQLTYCYECFDFAAVKDWEDHCNGHLKHDLSRRCEIITYCHTLIRPGYCPLCLGNESLPPSERLKAWKRSNELRNHIYNDIAKMGSKYKCSHPMCQIEFDSEIRLRYHLSDIHGLQKAIWASPRRTAPNRGRPEAQSKVIDTHCRKRRQGLDKTRAETRRKISHGEVGTLQIIQWAAVPEINIDCVSFCENPEIGRQHDGSRPPRVNNERPLQISQFDPHVPPVQPISTSHYVHDVQSIPLAMDSGFGHPCPLGPTGGKGDSHCCDTLSFKQPDTISNLSDLSDLCFTNAGSEISMSSTSPESLPIDPQLLESKIVSVPGENRASNPGHKADASTHSECNPDAAGTAMSSTSFTSRGMNRLSMEILKSSSGLAGLSSTISVHDSPPLPRGHVDRDTQTMDSFGCAKTSVCQSIESNGRLTRAMKRRQASHKASVNGPQKADEPAQVKCNSNATVPSTSLALSGTNGLDKGILPNAADLEALTSSIDLDDSSPLLTVTVEENAENLDSLDCVKTAVAQPIQATGRLTRAMARRKAIHSQHDHALRPRTARSVKCF